MSARNRAFASSLATPSVPLSADTIFSSSPGCSPISSTRLLGSLTARLLPHFETCTTASVPATDAGYHRQDILQAGRVASMPVPVGGPASRVAPSGLAPSLAAPAPRRRHRALPCGARAAAAPPAGLRAARGAQDVDFRADPADHAHFGFRWVAL